MGPSCKVTIVKLDSELGQAVDVTFLLCAVKRVDAWRILFRHGLWYVIVDGSARSQEPDRGKRKLQLEGLSSQREHKQRNDKDETSRHDKVSRQQSNGWVAVIHAIPMQNPDHSDRLHPGESPVIEVDHLKNHENRLVSNARTAKSFLRCVRDLHAKCHKGGGKCRKKEQKNS